MIHRSTFALDEVTTRRIRSLAALWKVSQAEVIRRAVTQADASLSAPDSLAMLEELHRSDQGLTDKEAKAYLAGVRKDRKQWRTP